MRRVEGGIHCAFVKERSSLNLGSLRVALAVWMASSSIVGGIAKHNRRNRRLRSGGKPLADSYHRGVRIANNLVDSGNMNLITAFR